MKSNGYLGLCPACGKLSWNRRKLAKQHARRTHPGDRMQAYECRHQTGFYHYGHCPDAVRHGVYSTADYYRPVREWTAITEGQAA